MSLYCCQVPYTYNAVLARAEERSKMSNNFILEFHDHIWYHHEKWIQISTNMPGIGSLIREIRVKISENLREEKYFCSVKKRISAF